MIVALDLSLTNLAMVACPPSWDTSWDRIEAFETWQSKAHTHLVARIDGLAAQVVRFCRDVNASEVWAEDLSSSQGYSIVVLGELRFGVRRALFRELGIDLQFVSNSTARKLLLGWVPRDKRKEHLEEALKAAGAPFEDEHQRDAWCVLNWALNYYGGPCLTGLLGEKPVKPKAPRKRKATVLKGVRASDWLKEIGQ